MKFFLVLVVVLAVIWLWRSKRQSDPKFKRQAAKAMPELPSMVRCTLCSVHVPAGDAVPGKKGAYCSAEHRQRAEP